MDCKRVEQLLPLHAGGDLEDGRERAALNAHLGGCEACRRRADEWAESMSLLRLDEPPEFDAAFFDPIRRDVMREITATTTRPARPALAALFAQLLRPQPLAYAASLALVCAALFLALRPSPAPLPSKLAGGGLAPSVNKQFAFERETSNGPAHDTVADKGERRERRERALPVLRDRTTPRTPTGARESAVAKKATPRVEEDGPSSPSLARGESPTAAPQPPAHPAANAELAVIRDEREMLKIDLRTSDPDVRIIWFSPRPNEQSSPRSTNDKR